jgi:hypothetical protein
MNDDHEYDLLDELENMDFEEPEPEPEDESPEVYRILGMTLEEHERLASED